MTTSRHASMCWWHVWKRASKCNCGAVTDGEVLAEALERTLATPANDRLPNPWGQFKLRGAA